jgi:hypothetical protein
MADGSHVDRRKIIASELIPRWQRTVGIVFGSGMVPAVFFIFADLSVSYFWNDSRVYRTPP